MRRRSNSENISVCPSILYWIISRHHSRLGESDGERHVAPKGRDMHPDPRAEAPEREADALYRRVTLRLIPFLVICYMFAVIDRLNIAMAKLQMLSSLGFSEAVYGLGAGIFFIGYLLFDVPSNLILHRVGARWWLGRIMITWGVVSAGTAFVATPFWFYALRFLLGLAEAGFFAGLVLYATYWFPAARRGRIYALLLLAAPL